jgi:2-succinyl-5-enolpyruvyl-6-hydroxy-3-cyclohexene-1-carboxylate synthase
VSESSECARTLIGQLVAQGVTDFVLAPGSRSAGFALCLDASASAGLLRLHVRVDERAAGYLALGLAKGSGRCVAVVTTSGTAVGNLVPAVMEAHHAAVPLLVISADRPSWMVGFGANQTTDQGGIFSGFVSYAARVSAGAPPASWAAQAARAVLLATGATGGRRGPAHLNVELPEPLVESDTPSIILPAPAVVAGPGAALQPVRLTGRPRTLVLCGDAEPDVGLRAVELATAAGLPLVAEPSSNARRGSALRTGRLLLGGPLGQQVERVVVFGRPTLSRPMSALLARDDVEVVVVTDRCDFVDPGWRASVVIDAVEVEPGPEAWLHAWQQADLERSARVVELSERAPLSGLALASLVQASVPSDQLYCLGNSNAIRDADLAPVGREVPICRANRGLAGIDGTVSTAIGISLGAELPVTLLCGDLSFVHDAAALVIGPGEPRPRLRVVVADDNGGSIFATLEYGREEFAHAFERVFATPTGLDLEALVEGYGVPVRRLSGATEITAALAQPITGLEVLVVSLDRAGRASLARQLTQP